MASTTTTTICWCFDSLPERGVGTCRQSKTSPPILCPTPLFAICMFSWKKQDYKQKHTQRTLTSLTRHPCTVRLPTTKRRDASISTLDTDISRKNSYSRSLDLPVLHNFISVVPAHKRAWKRKPKPKPKLLRGELRHKTSLKYVGTKVKTNYDSRKRS